MSSGEAAARLRRSRRFPLEIRARRTPAAPAVIWGADAPDAKPTLTFAELEDLTRRAAHELARLGAAPGERVALLLPPGPAYPVALVALLRAGCVAVPLSTRLPPGAVPALLARVGCRRLVAAPGAGIPAGGIDLLDARMFWSAGAETRSAGGHGDERRASGARDSGALPPFDPAAPATLVFTSGSTGAPKAALHSFANHWASAVGSNRNIPLRPGDRWLLSLPLWHVGGLAVIFRCLQGGAAVVLADRDQPLADAILVRGITHVSLVATQLFRLLGDARGREALRSLKAALLGGGPVAAPLLDEAARLGARLVTSYGSTETASQAAATRPGDPPEALRTAGRPLPFREIALDDGGEILVRGRTLFAGYLEGGEVRAARDRGGWFHTGDLGHLDAAGRLVVDGRRDNMFISGGENIHPEEIERALVDFPGTLDAIVVPVPDAEFGARPAAFLRTASGRLPDPAALGAFLRRTLPGFKAPVRYLPWPDVAEGMKPDRRELARLAAPGNVPLPLWQRGEGGISRS